jgi:hypothetical protein
MTRFALCIARCSTPRIMTELAGVRHRSFHRALIMTCYDVFGPLSSRIMWPTTVTLPIQCETAVQLLREADGGPFSGPGAEAPSLAPERHGVTPLADASKSNAATGVPLCRCRAGARRSLRDQR